MIRRRRARNEKNPDVIVESVASVVTAPAQIVQGILRREAKLTPELISNQTIKSGAFINFVEMRKRFAGVEFLGCALAIHRWPQDVVQCALDQVGGWGEILQPLLV